MTPDLRFVGAAEAPPGTPRRSRPHVKDFPWPEYPGTVPGVTSGSTSAGDDGELGPEDGAESWHEEELCEDESDLWYEVETPEERQKRRALIRTDDREARAWVMADAEPFGAEGTMVVHGPSIVAQEAYLESVTRR
jgi:hypothetical protein